MIAVKVRNKNMGDLAAADLIIDELDLGAFSTVYKVVGTVKRYHLAGWMAVKCRNSRIVSENSYSEHAENSDFDVLVIGFRLNINEFSCFGEMKNLKKGVGGELKVKSEELRVEIQLYRD